MTTALMVLMVFLLGYGIYFLCTHLEKEEKDAKKAAQKNENGWSEILPGCLGRTIEVVVKDPMFGIGVIHSQKGVLRDLDDQWLEMVCEEKKKKIIKTYQIFMILKLKLTK